MRVRSVMLLVGSLLGSVLLVMAQQVMANAPSEPEDAGVIYHSRDARGAPVFSDRPPTGQAPAAQRPAPRVRNIMPAPTVAPDTAPRTSGPAAQATERVDYYQRIVITSPAAEATIRHPVAPVPVSYALTPALLPEHRVRLLRNGQPEPDMALDWPYRGAHELVVEVQDQQGKVLLRSPPVTVFVHRPSALLRPGASEEGDEDD